MLVPWVVLALAACSSQPSGGNSRGGGNGGGGGASGGRSSNSGGVSSISGSTGVSGGISIGGAANECANENPPPSCNVMADPGCGDGKINQASEACDDGNGIPGDGCSGSCTIEPRFVCPEPGKPCVSTIVCGDGMVGPGEACDDGNKTSGDGCSATCNLVEVGFSCRTAGQACIRVYVCGDGRVDPNEGCDDKNIVAGDGCDPRCRLETGFKCEGEPSKCSATKCQDGKAEGAESCDDGNAVALDGCSPTCQAEPKCPAVGACSSGCGDGIVLNEECDDGNVRNGDGCSSACKVEQGFTCKSDAPCEEVNGKCTLAVPVVYRDFNFSGSSGGHQDFQPGGTSNFVVAKGLVQDMWDADKKPVFSGKGNCIDKQGVGTACPTPPAFIHSTSSFAQWYRDAAPSSGPIPGTLRLWDNGKGGFVNRFGPNGEQFRAYPKGTIDGVVYPNPTWCSNTDCTDPNCATPPAGTVCLNDCLPDNNTNACFAAQVDWDGNPLFFPLDPPVGKILNDSRRGAKIPEQFGFIGWPWEKTIGPLLGLKASGVACLAADEATSGGWCHNFSFTTEVKYWFRYDAKATARLDFTGDDDVWVFVNGKLAVDLGGWHVPLAGSVTIDSTTAATYGLEDGKVYMIGVFQAERQIEGSSFRLTLAGFNLAKSDCRTNCGDGVVAAGEECDDGAANSGDYNHCSPNCTLGPRCGDGIRQEQFGEDCDGINDGAYGNCTPDCKTGLRCGDGIVTQPQEQCDDGKNDGSYGTCTSVCKLAPHCGDGVPNTQFEQCDDGNLVNGDGCNSACKTEVPK
ncbi:MAG: DUF4215 domain-containing protein [Polyangiaceae bacterium]